MNGQIALPLSQPLPLFFPSAAPSVGLAPELRSHRARYRRVRARRALTKDSPGPAGPPGSQSWLCEPYRGSEFGLLEAEPSRVRGSEIVVRTNLGQSLRSALTQRDLTGERMRLGRCYGADPYQPAEELFGVSREVLDALAEVRGLELLLTTRSPLVLRDQSLLRRLDLYHSVAVRVPLPTLDSELSALIEPFGPEPAARLEVVRRLAADGVAVEVAVSPVLARINSSADELEPLLAAARRAGAIDVSGSPLPESAVWRRRFGSWLAKNFPERASSVRRLVATRCPEATLSTLERLRLAYGFPTLRAGRG